MDINKLKAQLTIDEGRKKRIYLDTKGKVTGGVGRNLTDRDFSDDEINLMLENDINLVITQLDNLFPWWKYMSDARMVVLANMCFNLGITKLGQFKNTLKAMQEGRYNDAADAMLASAWASQVGERAQRLSKLMREG